MDPITYRDAGVNISEQDRLIEALKKINPAIGGFSGAIQLPLGEYRRPLLTASTDGVGTKVLVAEMLGRYDTLGIDLVAMVVNDLICCGSRPLCFLDYYATGRLRVERATELLQGVVEGCRQAQCPLLGGETAEMPGLYDGERFDLAGFGVGLVEEEKFIDGSRVAAGDAIVGLPSSGIHSNGLSLARKIFFEKMKLTAQDNCTGLDGTVGENLLTPTRIYVNCVMELCAKIDVRAIAHITGGGLSDNIPRILPENHRAELDSARWRIPPLFRILEENGPVERAEMWQTFNMGLGMTVITPAEQAEQAVAICRAHDLKASIVGVIASGKRKVVIN